MQQQEPLSLANANDIDDLKRTSEALRKSEHRLQAAMEIAQLSVWEYNGDTGTIDFDQRFAEMLGLDEQRTITIDEFLNSFVLAEDRERVSADIRSALDPNGLGVYKTQYRILRSDGTQRWLATRGHAVYETIGTIKRLASFVGTVMDITGRKEAEAALSKSELRYRLMAENMADVVWVLDLEAERFTYVSPSVRKLRGYTPEEVIAQPLSAALTPESARRVKELLTLWIPKFLSDPSIPTFVTSEVDQPCKDGSIVHTEVTTNVVINEKGKIEIIGVSRNCTERKRAEEEKARLESQLAQAQKMEFVGRLAGGIAHDFNNMLNVILGHTELALEQVSPTHALREDLAEIQRAAERSAEFTRQLLAFARKQTVAPKILDLNEIVSGMTKMIGRLIGENILIEWKPGQDIWNVRMDPSQIDQILANLAVNARDAIEGVGTLTIETANATLDDRYCATHEGCAPGDYVRLAVADSGIGMDGEILKHIFEPFFTTKAVGKGTGLGLATVYGIVKQNKGYIAVESQPGNGSKFEVYLPRFVGNVAARELDGSEKRTPGKETILLVEDEQSILKLTARMLEQQGYSVLTAITPTKALTLAQEYDGSINILITDVIMPEMNGRELAKRLQSLYPLLECVFMSGWTADIIAPQGVMEPETYFLQKPFTKKELAAVLERVRNSPRR